MRASRRLILFLSRRYVTAWRRQTTLVVLAVAGSVALFILTGAMLAGLREATLEKALGSTIPHVKVELDGKSLEELEDVLSGIENVESYSPRVDVPAIAEGRANVLLRGVRPSTEFRFSNLREYLVEGELSLRRGEALVGDGLAESLGLGLGSLVALTLPSGETVEFRVAGILDTGAVELDSKLVLVSLDTLGVDVGEYGYVALRLRDLESADEVVEELRALGYDAVGWKELARGVLDLLRTERLYSTMLMCVIVAVAGLGITNVTLMLVESKRVEIGVLKAVGVTSEEVLLTYLAVALAYAVLGYALGLSISLAVSRTVGHVTAEWAHETLEIAVEVTPRLAILGLAYSTLVAVASSAYSAFRASRVRPAEVLRFG
ncbi:MAG TPA: ABC transporter permease [Candidatus Korarchaeota archaeon]|nr:ABC transporter permease [Candidatus Korarchaeota archaeon]